MSTPVMIEAQGLCKQFGSFLAVRDVTFAIPKGRSWPSSGPNGAGKTTTMRLLTGFVAPTHGSARIAGIDVQADRIEAAEHLGYLPENGPLYPDMTPIGLLQFFGEARGLSRPAPEEPDRRRHRPVLARVGRPQADRQALQGVPPAGLDGPGAAARPGSPDHGRADQRPRPEPDPRRPQADPRAGQVEDRSSSRPTSSRRSSRSPTASCSSTTARSSSTASPPSCAAEGRTLEEPVLPPDGPAGLIDPEASVGRRARARLDRDGSTPTRPSRRLAIPIRGIASGDDARNRNRPAAARRGRRPARRRRRAVPPARDLGGLQAQLPELLQQPGRLRVHHPLRARQLVGGVLAARSSSPTTWRTSTR